MFPIESVFNEIAQTFPDPSLIHMDVPSGKSVDEINQSKKATPLPAVSKPTSTLKQDHSVPHINARDSDSVSTTHPINEEIPNVVAEDIGSSGSRDNDGINGTLTASNIQWYDLLAASPN